MSCSEWTYTIRKFSPFYKKLLEAPGTKEFKVNHTCVTKLDQWSLKLSLFCVFLPTEQCATSMKTEYETENIKMQSGHRCQWSALMQ